MDIIIKAGQLLLSLSILVVLHELGHFLPAKWFKTKVEKFYLFFDAGFSLFKVKKGDTEYGIGWIPLGGYVKISGMIDESMDKEQMSKPPEPWEFRAKPAWQRLIIMLGGVTVNVILGFIIYAMTMWVWGEEYIAPQAATYGWHVDPILEDFGFEQGDVVVYADGEAVKSTSHINRDLVLHTPQEVKVLRGEEEVSLTIPEDFGQLLIDSGIKSAFALNVPCIVDTIIQSGTAKNVLQKGDEVVSINGRNMPYFLDFADELSNHKGETVTIGYLRNNELGHGTVEVNNEGKIGFGPDYSPVKAMEKTSKTYTFGAAIPAGFKKAQGVLEGYIISMKFIFSKAGVKQLGGFASIGNMFSATWDWESFWNMTALLSLILAVMNILPIPALDGGHVMFLLYEMIAGRPPGQKFMERAQIGGMIFLLALLLFANGNDVYRLIFKY